MSLHSVSFVLRVLNNKYFHFYAMRCHALVLGTKTPSKLHCQGDSDLMMQKVTLCVPQMSQAFHSFDTLSVFDARGKLIVRFM